MKVHQREVPVQALDVAMVVPLGLDPLVVKILPAPGEVVSRVKVSSAGMAQSRTAQGTVLRVTVPRWDEEVISRGQVQPIATGVVENLRDAARLERFISQGGRRRDNITQR